MARYRIVPEQSQVLIDAKSSLHPIHTRTDGLEASSTWRCTAAGASTCTCAPRAKLSFPVEQLSSGNPLEDRELQRRIDARRFPTIDGELSEMHEARARRPLPRRGAISRSAASPTPTRTR